MKQKMKFNLLLSDEIPTPADTIYDSSADSVDMRRSRLIGDLVIECIHAHAFLNGLNVKTGMDVRFNKVKDFVLNRFIKKTVQLHHDLAVKQTITSSVRHGQESLKNDCVRPEFKETLVRLRLDSATKYNDLLNADIVYLGTGEKIKFADYVNNKDMGFSTILTQEITGEDNDQMMREKVVNLCEKWVDALYGGMTKQTSPKKGRVWSGWGTGEHRFRNWFERVRDLAGNILIAMGNYVKGNKSDNTDKGLNSEIEIEHHTNN